MNHILVVEDEKKLNDIVRDYLVSLGYSVDQSFSGPAAVDSALNKNFSLIVLDIMLPGFDGIEVIRRIHMVKEVPVIMLTARDAEADKLLGFEVGADDYMTKPFSIRELGARIRSVLHRYDGRALLGYGQTKILTAGTVEIDCSRRIVKKSGRKILLTAAQFDLLGILFSKAGCAFSRNELINQLCGCEYEGYERTIDVHIKNIRKVLEDDPANPVIIQTVWGYGYKIADV